QIGLSKRIYMGWKTFESGVFLASYGGDTVFLHGIIKRQEKCMWEKKLLQILTMGNRTKMYEIHGLHLLYGHFQQWAGRMKRVKILNVISQQMYLLLGMTSSFSG